jgi:hypothetical protein
MKQKNKKKYRLFSFCSIADEDIDQIKENLKSNPHKQIFKR